MVCCNRDLNSQLAFRYIPAEFESLDVEGDDSAKTG